MHCFLDFNSCELTSTVPLLPLFLCFSCRLSGCVCVTNNEQRLFCAPDLQWHGMACIHTLHLAFLQRKSGWKYPNCPWETKTHAVSWIVRKYCLDSAKWHKVKHRQGAQQLLNDIDISMLIFRLNRWLWLFRLFTSIDTLWGWDQLLFLLVKWCYPNRFIIADEISLEWWK